MPNYEIGAYAGTGAKHAAPLPKRGNKTHRRALHGKRAKPPRGRGKHVMPKAYAHMQRKNAKMTRRGT